MSTWIVRTNEGENPVRSVTAHYMVIQGGHLIFRVNTAGRYPVVVLAFAPGAWLEVEEV